MTKELLPIPSYLLTPNDWAAEAVKRAAEYAGMPEGSTFLVEARRYLALGERIRCLETELKNKSD
jgi:hypothetical protein